MAKEGMKQESELRNSGMWRIRTVSNNREKKLRTRREKTNMPERVLTNEWIHQEQKIVKIEI
jgi:hypothetical protein